MVDDGSYVVDDEEEVAVVDGGMDVDDVGNGDDG